MVEETFTFFFAKGLKLIPVPERNMVVQTGRLIGVSLESSWALLPDRSNLPTPNSYPK